ncbi:MAG: PHP domain-containing protein [Candidatus Latescibacterota bacterium]|nr:MAG: PHP domain-containing protein [Candidatus Latescibacterota bacterium]
MRIDLHMHSTFSDGLFTPTQLVEKADKKKLVAISLTDHDCLDGTHEAVSAGKEYGIEILSGVELSCEFKGRDLHILGYGVDPDHEEFQDMLRRFRDTREKRGLKIIEKLGKLGMSIDPDDVMAKSGPGALGRPHIAAVLFEKGHVRSPNEAFDRYIAEGGPAYVPKYKMAPPEAIQHIRRAGGLAFMAHPGIFLSDMDEMAALLEEGFDGVEVYHSKHDAEMVKGLIAIAEEKDLLISGGSDYHGFTNRDLPIGALDISYDLLQKINDRLAA